MKEFIISAADDGRKLEKWLIREMPTVGMGLRQKLYRQKCFKLNGAHVKGDARLSKGDVLQIYASDALFEKPRREDPFLSKIRPELRILYEDENLLLADKRPGLMAHPDANEKVRTLLTHAQAYLYQKGEYDPAAPEAFAPALCNRIDRFTAGIVILAKTQEALRAMDAKIRTHEVQKYYLCIVHGRMKYPEGTLRHWLTKKPEQKKVTVLRKNEPGSKEAVTYYQVIDERDGLTLCECLLGTGRTHQIRAQFAAIGHPLLGDNQYGQAKLNEKTGRVSGQALCAYRLIFDFEGDAGCLNGLNGLTVQVKDVPFVREYFPDVVIPAP